MIHVAVPRRYRAPRVPTRAVAEADPFRHGRADQVSQGVVRRIDGAGRGIDQLEAHARIVALQELLAEPVVATVRTVDELDPVGEPLRDRGDRAVLAASE